MTLCQEVKLVYSAAPPELTRAIFTHCIEPIYIQLYHVLPLKICSQNKQVWKTVERNGQHHSKLTQADTCITETSTYANS